jgi:hypothetical protein
MYLTSRILFICIIMTICSCAQITVKNDEINNKTILNMKMLIRAKEYTLVNYIEIEFIREITKQLYEPIQLKLNIHPIKRFQIFDDIVNVKIDDKVYKLKMKSVTADILSNLTGSKSSSDISLDINGIRGNGLSPTIKLTKEIEKVMLNAKTIMFSITSGPEFALCKFNENDIKNIKRFITYKPN